MKRAEKLAEEYADSSDNESGSFLSGDLVNIRKKAFLAGYAAGEARMKERAFNIAHNWGFTVDRLWPESHELNLFLREQNLAIESKIKALEQEQDENE